MNLLDVLEPLLPAAAIAAVITGLVYVGGARRSRRYRPGRPFEFTPVWFLAKPEQLTEGGERAALPAGAHRAELSSTEHHRPGPLLAQDPQVAPQSVTGGASDRW